MIGGLTIATWVLLALPALAIIISVGGWMRQAR